jgi:LysR family transcriptional regulator for bpeEF and oprC
VDKLRAIQYFNRAVEAGSFSAAAKSLSVSTPAVTQMVGALERLLGVALFHRTTRGLSLTAEGERYYKTSSRLAAEFMDLDLRVSSRSGKPHGTLTVGLWPSLGQHCVMPRIARFVERFPDIELVVKLVRTIQDFETANVDISVLLGWTDVRKLVVRPLAQMRYVVCAAPEYWARNGRPHEPEELRNHQCILQSRPDEPLLDRWIFEKGTERRSVDVHGRLLGNYRDFLLEAACAGAGVIRVNDITAAPFLRAGRIVPVLADWEILEAPPVFAVYRRTERHSKLVRVFLDFLVEIFAEIESERTPAPAGALPRAPRPEWFGRARGRRSAYVARGRKSRG